MDIADVSPFSCCSPPRRRDLFDIQHVCRYNVSATEVERMADARNFTVKKTSSLTDKAYCALKESICSISIEPGTLLSEGQIAKELGMSRTPVRESLKMLENEGLVEIRVGIGAFVKQISYKDLMDLYAVRKVMEVLAVRTSVDNIRKSDIRQLEEKFQALLEKHANDEEITVGEFINTDLSLHKLIIDKCDNQYIQNFMNTIFDNIKRVQTVSFEELDDIEESTKQHLELLDLIARRKKEELVIRLGEHIDWSMSCIRAY